MKTNNLFFIFLLCLSLNADQSPFISPQSIDQNAIAPEFDKAEIRFNSDARILKSIQLEYIALDGSTKTLVVDINKSIDWHNLYLLSKASKPNSTAVLDVSVTIPEKALPTEAELNSSTEFQFPENNGKLEEFISFASFNNRIKINTQDEMISDFIVGNPSKIVLDFKRDTAFNTKNIKLGSNTPFTRMILGSHKGYYRLVIYMDGKYNYRLEKDASGYTLHLL
ncbi:AMIN domain-containing protein [Campylobacter sp. MIT 12-5580]|uniref:AMIN domain-containing protein n=1 Tax=Campylobacter sp. MIT 12-5580 TaxID=2040651 RepID=UPI0010F872F9|nr:AMIN domain-containing protein [Campylobacter sp. MIT 12-5580]TKX30095.1 AMIN domain-containing protein [Campylobacter sp. MIT 12-5580]